MDHTDTGLLFLRILLAALLFGHATQKSVGWFGGGGRSSTAPVFESWGFRPGHVMVTVAAVSELVGATLIVTGLAFPLGCAIVLGTMIVAASPNAKNGLWAQQGGCEVPVVYGALAAGLAFTGPGSASLDDALDLYTYQWWLPVVAVAVGVAASIPPIVRSRSLLRASTRSR
ncbi:MAG: DoxX family protein [Aeromicrobium sp.]|jgi:putative oxidoreductase